ncbi:MAG: Abhydrolase 3 protein [Chloroflexota bacterium]|nr:Abhydrolase 3 protein [Chloroflexota bacterium]
MSHGVGLGRVRRLALSAVTLLALFAGAILVLAFAEEPLPFRDPVSGELTDEEVSTIHDDLTYVLALAAGFSISDSITLQIWDQLTDSEALGPGAVVSYTNGGGAFYPAPDPDVVCAGKIHSKILWPRAGDIVISTSVTTRFGVYSPFFHFPRQTPAELGALHDWGWGAANTLIGYEAYAWGGPASATVMGASCLYTRSAVITAPMAAGSLEAFATYLHALADSHSHLACITAMDALGRPWATHTTPPIDQSVPACDYHPHTPQAADVHGREFYTHTDALRTDAAILAIYGELTARSMAREGRFRPFGLDEPLAGMAGSPTLSQTLAAFVHTWEFDAATQRRAYADQIAAAVLAQRQGRWRIYLPVLVRY